MASAEMRQSRSKVKAWIKQIQKQPQDLVTAHVARSRSFDRHARFQQSALSNKLALLKQREKPPET
jgi:hypothetical protein